MTASELRIGNLVDVINRHHTIHMPYGFVKKIGQVQFFKVHLYEYDKPFSTQPENELHDISDLSPIPLTEEWLFKFGFFRPFMPPIYEIVTSEMDKRFRIHKVDDNAFILGRYESTSIKIQYVHQLQNLYFALTGEELEIIK